MKSDYKKCYTGGMEGNESSHFDSASDRRKFLQTYRENLQLEPPDLNQIEREIRERNPAILDDLNTILDHHYADKDERLKARTAGLRLLHLVYA